MLMQVVTNGPTNRSKDERETTTMAFDTPQVLPVSTFDYNGNSLSPPSDLARLNLDGSPNQMLLSFDMRNPIDLSIDPTRQSNAMMQDPQLSPTNARLTKINREGTAAGDYSQFVDDQNMMDMFINQADDRENSLEKDGLFQEIDMGEMDEEDRQYLLVDKDTGRVYDLRKDEVVTKITAKSTRIT